MPRRRTPSKVKIPWDRIHSELKKIVGEKRPSALAKEIGSSRSTVGKRAGQHEPSLQRIAAIAATAGLSLADFFLRVEGRTISDLNQPVELDDSSPDPDKQLGKPTAVLTPENVEKLKLELKQELLYDIGTAIATFPGHRDRTPGSDTKIPDTSSTQHSGGKGGVGDR